MPPPCAAYLRIYAVHARARRSDARDGRYVSFDFDVDGVVEKKVSARGGVGRRAARVAGDEDIGEIDPDAISGSDSDAASIWSDADSLAVNAAEEGEDDASSSTSYGDDWS